MTALEALETYRPRLQAGLQRVLDGLDYSHAAPLRDEIGSFATASAGTALAPSVLCLLSAEAFGVSADAALPAATSLALLAAMGMVFRDLAAERGAVKERWGLPRTLNAGDGFFALAQASIASSSANAAVRLAAGGLLDLAARELSNELGNVGPGVSRTASPALLAAAGALGALFGGADAATVEALTAIDWSESGASIVAQLDRISISADARKRLAEAAGLVAKFE